jgi:hypothetical protein
MSDEAQKPEDIETEEEQPSDNQRSEMTPPPLGVSVSDTVKAIDKPA